MSQNSIILAYKEFLYSIEKLRHFARENNKTESLERFHLEGSDTFPKIIHAFEKASKEPWLLQCCCSQVIWKACRQHMGNVYTLPIPGRLRDIILMFH
ncbi:unnamed protein product [Lymnaea stagnalis]|uniref:Uncharacterized protein n=1 Tax=Lymnaea stagnalis TaxID=6523 RepID=A0AAV2H5I5_LYMST